MHNEMPVSGTGITGSAFPEWRFPLYRNSGFHDRTSGVKQPGILNPLFRKNLDPIIHAMLNTFLCNSFL